MPDSDVASSVVETPGIEALAPPAGPLSGRARNADGELLQKGLSQSDLDAFRANWPEKYEEVYGSKRGKTPAEKPVHPFLAAVNAPPKGEKAKAAPIAETATDAPATNEQPKAQDAPKAGPTVSETIARDKAVKALKLDGFTDTALAKLDAAEIIELGQAATKRHAAFDKRLAKAGQEPKQLTAESAKRELPANMQAKVKELADEIGSDKAGKVVSELLDEPMQRLEQIEIERIAEQADSARTALADSLPGLSEEDVYSEVLDEMGDLRKTKRWGNAPMKDLMRAAYRNVVPEPTAAELASDRLQKQGTAATPAASAAASRSSAVVDPKTLSRDQRIDIIYQALERGATRAEAEAEAGY